MKKHLAGQKGDISSCKKVPFDIRYQMEQSLKEIEKEKEKEGQRTKSVGEDNFYHADDVEEELNMLELNAPTQKKVPTSSGKRKRDQKLPQSFAPRTTPGAQPSIKSVPVRRMSDTVEDCGVRLKVMINKEKTKVLFAEAECDSADVLLSFLTLPLGRIAKLLEKHYGDNSPVFGCITSLYKGLANLDDVHFTSCVSKQMLLEPRSSHETVYMYYGVNKASCSNGHPLNHEVVVDSYNTAEDLFTIKSSSVIFSDDLQMLPYSTGFFQALINLGITGVDGAELRNVAMGTDEVRNLLKCFLFSKTPLSDFILNKGEIMSPLESGSFERHESSNSDKKIVLKIMVHKSTNKVLFAQAEDDFVELLFTFLIIPIGGLQSLTNSHTGHKNLDNLCRSISDVIDASYFISQDAKKRLFNPDIPCFFKPQNTFLPLNEETAPTIYYYYDNYHQNCPAPICFSHKPFPPNKPIGTLKSPKGEEGYVKKPTTYMVTDDLTVPPFHLSSTFSILNSLNISLSEVEELQMAIGLQEGLSILKAALTSTSALTNGLMDRITMKKPSKNIKSHFC